MLDGKCLIVGFACAWVISANATTVEIINPSAEINSGIEGVSIGNDAVLGWNATHGTLEIGDIDFGNGAWRLGYDNTGAVYQMTAHTIQAGDSFSLRFDASIFSIGGEDTLNHDFNADSSSIDARSFAQTPNWTNLGTGDQDSQATRLTKPTDGTRNAVLSHSVDNIFGTDTGYTLASNDIFTITYEWLDASGWNDSTDRVRVTLFTTADDTITGTHTNLASMDSDLVSSSDTYETQTSIFPGIPSSAHGKHLFLEIDTVSNDGAGYGRLDNLTLQRGDEEPPSAPGTRQIVADFYVENAGTNQVAFSRALNFKSLTIGDWKHYHAVVPSGTLDSVEGQTLGIQFRGSSATQSIDNVRLETWGVGLADGSFSNDWNTVPDQVWPGPGYWGNRLHDWQVASNRVNAVGASDLTNLRTLHRIGTSIRGNGGDFHLAVRTGLHSGSLNDDSRSGFLIGSGFNLDWRGALLVHSAWGRDFGLFCGMRGNGAAVIEDYSNASTNSVGTLGATPAILPADARIEFDAIFNITNYNLTVSVYDGASLVSQAIATVDSDRMLGSFGLLSHRGSGNSAFWFDDFNGRGAALQYEPNRQLAIVGAMHTLSRGTLKLTAQMMPFDLVTTPDVFLDIWDGSAWQQIAAQTIDSNALSAYNATFRITHWNDTVDVPYRVRLPLGGEDYTWEGTIRKDPVEKEELVICGLTGQRIASGRLGTSRDWSPVHVWHPHAKPIEHIAKFKPDIIVATGDQIYENQPTWSDNSSSFARHHDYLYKWILWLLQWREQGRDVPLIVIPDDHDVYQGNLWGEGGVPSSNQDVGGYVRPADWVKMVERTQVENLPDPDPYNAVQPAPSVAQGIKVYFTGMVYGRVGIAIIEDRKFKTGQTDPPPEEEQVLLGQRQHDFLEAWAKDWSGQELKFMVSQSPIANLHTHASSGYSFSVDDRDTHGWPVHRRNEAWEHIRKSFMFQLAGDQHLATVALHGVDAPRDAGYSFTVPALANFWPRAWDPVHDSGGRTSTISPYTGDFFFDGSGLLPDGVTSNLTSEFPHHFKMLAVGNPAQYHNQTRGIDPSTLHDRGAGYGIVRIEKSTRKVTFECWPRFADPEYPSTGSQYPDWPITISQFDNYVRTPVGFLQPVDTGASDNPVICVVDETTGETVYSLRIRGNRFLAPVYDAGTTYRIEIYEGDASAPTTVRTGQIVDVDTAHQIDLFDASGRNIVEGQTVRLRWQTRGSSTVRIDQGVGDVSLFDALGSGYVEVLPTVDTTYTLTSSNGVGGVEQAATSVRIFPTRETWRTNHFTQIELTDPMISGDDADPDGDGIHNWLEHLLGGLPKTASTDILPISRTAGQPDGKEYAIHEYTELIETGEAAYEFQAGNDLVGWETVVPPGVEEIARVPGGVDIPDRVTARQLPPFEDDARPKRFYRLKILDLR